MTLPTIYRVLSVLFFAGQVTAVHAAEPLPLSKEYWRDPSFLASFNGSYRINARIEPAVNSEQRALLMQVQSQMKKGQRKAALNLLDKSPLTKSSAALIYNKGNLQLELGQTEEAIRSFKKALELFPSFRRAFKNLGTAFVQNANYKDAERALRHAVQLGELDGSTLGLLGYCYLQSEQYASALQAYRMAQLTQPHVVEWKAGVAQCLAEVREDQEALKLIEEVVESRPTEVSYQLLLINLQLRLEKEMDAIAGLQLLRKQNLLEHENLALLASLYLRADDLRMARPVIEELRVGLVPETLPAYLGVVSGVIGVSEWAYAKDLLESVRSVEKSDKLLNQAERLEAFVRIQQGEEGAVALLEKVIERDPLDGDALLMLAGVKVAKKDFEYAALLFDRAEKVPATQYQALLESGKMLVANKRYKLALPKLKDALALKKTEALAKYISAVEGLAKAW